MFYELIVGTELFEKQTDQFIANAHQNYNYSFPHNCTDQLQDLIRRGMECDENKRISILEINKHPLWQIWKNNRAHPTTQVRGSHSLEAKSVPKQVKRKSKLEN